MKGMVAVIMLLVAALTVGVLITLIVYQDSVLEAVPDAPSSIRYKRINVEGIDCVVVSVSGPAVAVDCDWRE